MTGTVSIVRPGVLTTVQDLGRRGFAHLAVPRGGALDPGAMRLANRLVGNPEHAAVLETTFDGVAFLTSDRRNVAVTGAAAPVHLDHRDAAWGRRLTVDAGHLLDVGRASAGLRCFVALSGGIEVAPLLGSRSTDLLAGIGPPPLRRGDVLPLDDAHAAPVDADAVPHSQPPPELHLPCLLGPRDDELDEETLMLLASARWLVTADSNRVALRLSGPALALRRRSELPSEGLVAGAVQVPPDGQPVLFLADHPWTGGYPVVAVVPEPELHRCAQSVPGSWIHLHPAQLPPL